MKQTGKLEQQEAYQSIIKNLETLRFEGGIAKDEIEALLDIQKNLRFLAEPSKQECQTSSNQGKLVAGFA